MSNVNELITVTPKYIIQGAGNMTIDGVGMGGFEAGIRITYSQTETFIESECSLGKIKGEITGQSMQVATELEEATLENLAIAWGLHTCSVLSQATSTSKTLELIPVQNMREVELIFRGMSAENNDLSRVFTCYRAVRVGSSESTLRRATKTLLPVTFECLQNSSRSFGNIVEYGKGTIS